MSTSTPAVCTADKMTADVAVHAGSSRFADYATLLKPRISIVVLFSVSAGFVLASPGIWPPALLVWTLVGVAAVAGASSALNQYLERHTDRHMPRTAARPLPAGRLAPSEVLWFGLLLGTAGIVALAFTVNLLTAALAALTLTLYVGAYTPLKRRTCLATVIGAVPGAMPPVLGWTAAGGSLDMGAFSVFALLFLWQFPHFLAIAWLYRHEYAAAGLKMLPFEGKMPRVIGGLAVAYSLVLIPFSLQPSLHSVAGPGSAMAALILGIMYFVASVRFLVQESRESARGLLWTSLVYLPVLLSVLVWDHLRLLS